MRKILPLAITASLGLGLLEGLTYLGERYSPLTANKFTCGHALAHIESHNFLDKTLLYPAKIGAQGFYEANCR